MQGETYHERYILSPLLTIYRLVQLPPSIGKLQMLWFEPQDHLLMISITLDTLFNTLTKAKKQNSSCRMRAAELTLLNV